MRFRGLVQIFIVAFAAQMVTGCGAIIQSAMVGAGKAATVEDTGFIKNYQGLAPSQDPAFPGLPDLSHVSPQVRMGAYSKIIMPDFTSITPDIDKLKGLQIRQYKGIKQELPDLIASTFDGTLFSKVTRYSERLDPKDIAAIRKLPADAVLLGNIKELVSLGGEGKAGLTAIQIEYKLIDTRTGEEVVTAIHRSTTDLDKVAMGQVRVLTSVLNKAKAMKASASSDAGQVAVPVAVAANPMPSNDVPKVNAAQKGGRDLSAAEVISRNLNNTAGCQAGEIGSITKVEVISGKQVGKLTRGGLKVDPAKMFVVVYSKRGKAQTYAVSPDPVTASVKGADLTAKLIGKPACVADAQG